MRLLVIKRDSGIQGGMLVLESRDSVLQLVPVLSTAYLVECYLSDNPPAFRQVS